ncbi:MAG TPA: permease-like cell division protein FtsX [Solirubrobacterales bacterium]|nr:permease-like cell division protein FtsX [Solirubrobacterales bacterium]
MGRITFFVAEAFRALGRSAAPSVAAIVTVAVTTLLLGVLIPVLRASESTTQEVRSQISLDVWLYDDATKRNIRDLRAEIEAIPGVAGTEFVSKREGKQIVIERLDDPGAFAELNRNPLPNKFTVELSSPDNLTSVSAALQPPDESGEPQPIRPIIESVREAREEATEITQVTGAVTIVLVVIAVLLLVASLLLIANTIRLSIYARRREVEVMRLVGATNWFVRWPFVIEGVLVGIIGAGIAVAILWLGKVTIVDPLADNFALIHNFSTVGFPFLVGMLVAAAVLVSALGSGITLRRFLRV